jgi:hypothetical protein
MAAAGLADVLAGDAQPLEPGGIGEHARQQLAVLRLGPGSLVQGPVGFRHSRRERIPDRLELA